MGAMGAMGRHGWVAGGVVLLLAGAGIWATRHGGGETDDLTARAVVYAARIGLPLPAGTRVAFAEWTTGLDDSARLSFIMPEVGWASLRAGMPALTFETENNFHLGRDRDVWRPQSAPGLTTAQVQWRDRAEVMNIGVAPVGLGEVRVFVFWHQI